MLIDRNQIIETATLGDIPRVELFDQASTIHRLPALSEALGPGVSVKRDDTLPLAMGGNKVRQLEYYLGPAREQQADLVLITGAIQSNFVRLCAAAAIRMNARALVQLEHRVPRQDSAYLNSGNVLLDKLLGAEIVHFDGGDDEAAADRALDQIASNRADKGFRPYVIHLGMDHPPLGALGYVEAAVETWLQCNQSGEWPDHVIIPSGSGLTHAGFLVGARMMGWQVPVHGICVRRNAQLQQARISRRADEIIRLIGADLQLDAADVRVDDSVLAPGYGQINDAVSEAMALAAQREALLLDPVYSGRTLAGLVRLCRRNEISAQQRVLFIHTGGTPALFAYQQDLAI